MERTSDAVNRLRALFRRPKTVQEYEPLDNGVDGEIDEDVRPPVRIRPDTVEPSFSWLEYSVFLLLGIAMLWAW
jgi:solute carrier family 29 (equilibrative nucleoside transporter), member 1/2/3